MGPRAETLSRSEPASPADPGNLGPSNLFGCVASRAARRGVGVAHLLRNIFPRAQDELGHSSEFFDVALVKVPPDPQVQREVMRHFPVILNKQADLPISPGTIVGRQLRGLPANDPRVNSCILNGRGICREKQRVKEIVRGASHVKLAVLDVATEVAACLNVVFPVIDRDHVRIRVDVLVEELGIPVIGAKRDIPRAHTNEGNARLTGRNADVGPIPQVTTLQFIEDGGGENVRPGERKVGVITRGTIFESSHVVRIVGAKLVAGVLRIESPKNAVVLPDIVVDAGGPRIAIEKVPTRLGTKLRNR